MTKKRSAWVTPGDVNQTLLGVLPRRASVFRVELVWATGLGAPEWRWQCTVRARVGFTDESSREISGSGPDMPSAVAALADEAASVDLLRSAGTR